MKLITVEMPVHLPCLIHWQMIKGINTASLPKILINPKLAHPTIVVRIRPPTPPCPHLNGHQKMIPYHDQYRNTMVLQSRRRLGTMPTRLTQPPSSTGITRLPRIIIELGIQFHPRIHNIGFIGESAASTMKKYQKI